MKTVNPKGFEAYLAPELLKSPVMDSQGKWGLKYDHKVDIWSCGAILYELFHLTMMWFKPPHDQWVPENLIRIWIRDRVLKNQHVEFAPDCPTAIVRLIRQCCDQSAARRPEARELLKQASEIKEITETVLEMKNQRTQQKISNLERKIEEYNEATRSKNKQIEKLVGENNQMRQELQASKALVMDTTAENTNLQAEIKQLSNVEQNNRQLSEENSEFRKEVQKLNVTLADMEFTNTSLRSKFEEQDKSFQEKFEQITAKNLELQKQLEGLKVSTSGLCQTTTVSTSSRSTSSASSFQLKPTEKRWAHRETIHLRKN